MSFTVGIDVCGTKVLGGVVVEAGVVHRIARRDTPKAGGAELNAAIAAVANELRQDFQVEAVGGFSGRICIIRSQDDFGNAKYC